MPNQIHPSNYYGAGQAAEESPLESEDKSMGMTPTEFILWLNGVIDVLDAHPPTQEQWDKMRDKVSEQVGAIVARRIRHAGAQTYSTTDSPDYTRAAAQLKYEQVQKQLAMQQVILEKDLASKKVEYERQWRAQDMAQDMLKNCAAVTSPPTPATPPWWKRRFDV